MTRCCESVHFCHRYTGRQGSKSHKPQTTFGSNILGIPGHRSLVNRTCLRAFEYMTFVRLLDNITIPDGKLQSVERGSVDCVYGTGLHD